MARSDAVWGIDIGQCALKALRCRRNPDGEGLVADAFDFIEYPKILSQPEADPVELVQEALQQFLSRNSVRGDRVAISVPGQMGLARFIKLPPVESKKIPDIVKYEARQQIPFALDDVVWDYQQMAGGSEEDGFALETEVGIFAMKRDQVERALTPFRRADIEVDVVQLAPLALYNYCVFDQMPNLPPPEEYNPDDPPESLVLLSLGTDTTDLVVTNGYRVWQRSVPMGGNHFTKALTKELKLTFAKAEHLKRNAAGASDPKAVFKAMRSEFSNLLQEVQRSLGYFTNLDRGAKIRRIVGLGNAMKLPGLQRYLAQHLEFDVGRLDGFKMLSGPGVVDAAAFRENMLAFPVCYGLAVQGLGLGAVRTNLIPREILKERMIRDKKPWAVGAAALLLFGLTLNSLGHWRAWDQVRDDRWETAVRRASDTVRQADGYKNEFRDVQQAFERTRAVGENLVRGVDSRVMWRDLLHAINLCLPRDDDALSKPLEQRNELHITRIDCVKVRSLSTWLNGIKRAGLYEQSTAGGGAAAASADDGGPTRGTGGSRGPRGPRGAGGPSGDRPAPATGGPPNTAGWVFEVAGYHYHNDSRAEPDNWGADFVRNTLLKNLEQRRIDGFPVKDLGIGYPVLLTRTPVQTAAIKDLEGLDDSELQKLAGQTSVRVYTFKVQFCWSETPRSVWEALPDEEPTTSPDEVAAGEIEDSDG